MEPFDNWEATNKILILKQRLIKVSALLESHAALQKNLKDLEETLVKERGEKDWALREMRRCLKKYHDKYNENVSQRQRIRQLEENISEHLKSLNSLQNEKDNLSSLVEVYKAERADCMSSEKLIKEKKDLLRTCHKLGKNAEKNQSTKAILKALRNRYKTDLKELGLVDFRFDAVKTEPKAACAESLKPAGSPVFSPDIQPIHSVESGFSEHDFVGDSPDAIEFPKEFSKNLMTMENLPDLDAEEINPFQESKGFTNTDAGIDDAATSCLPGGMDLIENSVKSALYCDININSDINSNKTIASKVVIHQDSAKDYLMVNKSPRRSRRLSERSKNFSHAKDYIEKGDASLCISELYNDSSQNLTTNTENESESMSSDTIKTNPCEKVYKSEHFKKLSKRTKVPQIPLISELISNCLGNDNANTNNCLDYCPSEKDKAETDLPFTDITEVAGLSSLSSDFITESIINEPIPIGEIERVEETTEVLINENITLNLKDAMNTSREKESAEDIPFDKLKENSEAVTMQTTCTSKSTEEIRECELDFEKFQKGFDIFLKELAYITSLPIIMPITSEVPSKKKTINNSKVLGKVKTLVEKSKKVVEVTEFCEKKERNTTQAEECLQPKILWTCENESVTKSFNAGSNNQFCDLLTNDKYETVVVGKVNDPSTIEDSSTLHSNNINYGDGKENKSKLPKKFRRKEVLKCEASVMKKRQNKKKKKSKTKKRKRNSDRTRDQNIPSALLLQFGDLVSKVIETSRNDIIRSLRGLFKRKRHRCRVSKNPVKNSWHVENLDSNIAVNNREPHDENPLSCVAYETISETEECSMATESSNFENEEYLSEEEMDEEDERVPFVRFSGCDTEYEKLLVELVLHKEYVCMDDLGNPSTKTVDEVDTLTCQTHESNRVSQRKENISESDDNQFFDSLSKKRRNLFVSESQEDNLDSEPELIIAEPEDNESIASPDAYPEKFLTEVYEVAQEDPPMEFQDSVENSIFEKERAIECGNSAARTPVKPDEDLKVSNMTLLGLNLRSMVNNLLNSVHPKEVCTEVDQPVQNRTMMEVQDNVETSICEEESFIERCDLNDDPAATLPVKPDKDLKVGDLTLHRKRLRSNGSNLQNPFYPKEACREIEESVQGISPITSQDNLGNFLYEEGSSIKSMDLTCSAPALVIKPDEDSKVNKYTLLKRRRRTKVNSLQNSVQCKEVFTEVDEPVRENSPKPFQDDVKNSLCEQNSTAENMDLSSACTPHKDWEVSKSTVTSRCLRSHVNNSPNVNNLQRPVRVLRNKTGKMATRLENDDGNKATDSFLDSIMSAMSKQTEDFKPNASIENSLFDNDIPINNHIIPVNYIPAKKSPPRGRSATNQGREERLLVENAGSPRKARNGISPKQNKASLRKAGNQKGQPRLKEALQKYLSANISSTAGGEAELRPCLTGIRNSAPASIASMIVAIVLENVDEDLELQLSYPIPPLTKTQHRLMTLLAVLKAQDDRYTEIIQTILKVIRTKLFPDTFFWPDDSVEMAVRFYTAVCKMLNDDEAMWKFFILALSDMRQRTGVAIYVVLKTWPDILPNASRIEGKHIPLTIVNLILHTPSTEESKRLGQEKKLMALKHLLMEFYHFEIKYTIEQYAAMLLDCFLKGEPGSEEALSLMARYRQWEFSKKHFLPKIKAFIQSWRKSQTSEEMVYKAVKFLGKVASTLPEENEDATKEATSIASHLYELLLSGKGSHATEERIVDSLLCLRSFVPVHEILSMWNPKETIDQKLRNKIAQASQVQKRKKVNPPRKVTTKPVAQIEKPEVETKKKKPGKRKRKPKANTKAFSLPNEKVKV